MKIIDSHVHVYPKKIARRAVQSIGEFYSIPMDCEGTVEDLIANSIADEFIIQSVAVDENHVETINNFIANECSMHECLHGFGTMHANYLNKIDELERMRALGLKGIKIHPDTQGFNMDDEAMSDVYDYARGNNMPVLIHCGDYRYDYSHPKRLKNVLKQFPGLKVLAAHFGGWSMFDLAYEYLYDEDCYLDTSSSMMLLGLKRTRELIKMYGAERVVFGTDYPMWDVKEEVSNIQKLNLSDSELELIFYKNAQKLLGV